MILYASIILCLILFYFGYRYFKSIERTQLQPSWLYKLLFIFSATLFLAYPAGGLIEYIFQGTFNRTGYPVMLIYLFWYGLVYMGVMFNWLILHDLILPVINQITQQKKSQSNRFFARLFLIVSLLTLIYTGGKMLWDTHRIATEEIHYALPNAPESFKPLTIIHIADLHADDFTRGSKIMRYIDKIHSFEPDLVLFAGDLITSGTDHILDGARALGQIEARYGTIAVLGDHDYWTDTGKIINALADNGIPVLHNNNTWINHGDASIKITGITELYSSRIHTDSLSTLLDESKGETLKLMVSHQATDRLIDQAVQGNMHQLLAGHTHGGQIRVPVFFYPVTAARAETRYVNGHWMLDKLLLNINNGLGFTLAPVRYHAPAQVSVIYVYSEK